MTVSDFAFFQSLKGKTIKCKKDFIWKKNSLKNVFAFKEEKITIKDFLSIYVKRESYVEDVKEKDIVDPSKITIFSFLVTRQNSPISDINYLPAIKSKRHFNIYFTIIEEDLSVKLK